jgi:hypothetical protein
MRMKGFMSRGSNHIVSVEENHNPAEYLSRCTALVDRQLVAKLDSFSEDKMVFKSCGITVVAQRQVQAQIPGVYTNALRIPQSTLKLEL